MKDERDETSECIDLLRSHPLFSIFSDELLTEFLENSTQKLYHPGQSIVQKGDVIDRILFIISGKAKVIINGKFKIFERGDTIGLSATGFYAEEDARTATVEAITAIKVLQLKIEDIETILERHPSLYTDETHLFKIKLLKKVAAFANLSTRQLAELASLAELKTIKKDRYVFKQDDESDSCYIIKSGEIAIDRTHDGKEQRLAVLKSPDIFGEIALIMSAPRNASALAITDVKLLAIQKDVFIEIMKMNKTTSEELNILLIERARPKRNPKIIQVAQKSVDNKDILILKNPDNSEYLQLEETGITAWNRFNGVYSVREAVAQIMAENPGFSVIGLKEIILTLTKYGFLILEGVTSQEQIKIEGFVYNLFYKIQQFAEIKYQFKKSNDWLYNSFNRWAKYLYTLPAQIVLMLFSLIGIVLFFTVAPQSIQFLANKSSWMMLTGAIITSSLIVILHELGHAYTTLYFKREVSGFGIGWYWIAPIAFTDTTDMWLSTPKERFFVDIAGNYANLIVAGLFLLVGFFTHNPAILTYCWLVAFLNYISVITNLDPTFEFDGYYILSDLLGAPNLREDAVIWLHNNFFLMMRNPRFFLKQYKTKEAIYWYIVLITITARIILVFLVQKLLIDNNIISSNYRDWAWVAPVVVLIISFITVWINTKRYLSS